MKLIEVEGIGEVMDEKKEKMDMVNRGGIGEFIYMEVMDERF